MLAGRTLPWRAAKARGVAAWDPTGRTVAEGEDTLFRSCLVLVAARATEGGVEAVGIDGVEQCGGLQTVPRGDRSRVGHAALVDGILDPGDK